MEEEGLGDVKSSFFQKNLPFQRGNSNICKNKDQKVTKYWNEINVGAKKKADSPKWFWKKSDCQWLLNEKRIQEQRNQRKASCKDRCVTTKAEKCPINVTVHPVCFIILVLLEEARQAQERAETELKKCRGEKLACRLDVNSCLSLTLSLLLGWLGTLSLACSQNQTLV